MPWQMASSTDSSTDSFVVSSNLTSTMKTLPKEKVIFLTSRIWWIALPVPRDCQQLRRARTAQYEDQRPRGSEGGETVVSPRLGRRSVNIFPVAQRTNGLAQLTKRKLTRTHHIVRVAFVCRLFFIVFCSFLDVFFVVFLFVVVWSFFYSGPKRVKPP